MPKKSNLLCCGGLPSLIVPSVPSPPAFHRRPWCRLYATAHDAAHDRNFTWPNSSSFTPYDIFRQDRAAPYSKSRFYDLVKAYHPDRPCNGHPLCRNITPEVRLQRYHLVVAAHEILSDPAKRAAYDQFGTGWNLHPSRNPHAYPAWTTTGPSPHDSVYNNATWEDWERWYNRHQGKQQQIVDHRTFVTFIFLLTLFGGAVQASWVNKLSTGYEDRLREVNEESVRLLAGRRESTVKQRGSPQASVEHFLMRRDPSGFGLKEDEQPVYQEMLQSRNHQHSSPLEAERSTQPDRQSIDDTVTSVKDS